MVQKVPCEGTDAAAAYAAWAENAAGFSGKVQRQSSAGAGADTECVHICNRYVTNIYIFLYISVANVSN